MAVIFFQSTTHLIQFSPFNYTYDELLHTCNFISQFECRLRMFTMVIMVVWLVGIRNFLFVIAGVEFN